MFSGFIQNWFLKLISLGAALALWFFVMGEQNVEVGYAVSLALVNEPPGLMIANDVPRLIDVRLSGPRTVLTQLQASDISLSVDLGGLKAGVTTFRSLGERFNLPRVLKITRLSPSFVEVRLDRILEKDVDIRVQLEGTVAKGYKVDRVRLNPPRAQIVGATGEVVGVNEVFAEKLKIDGVKESFTLITPLLYPGTFSRLGNVKAVEVAVDISAIGSEIIAPDKAPPDAQIEEPVDEETPVWN